jgi:hypothetical protein
VLACAEPPEGDTLTEPLLLVVVLLFAVVLLEPSSPDWPSPDSSFSVLELVVELVVELVLAVDDELSLLAVVVVDFVASVASRAARPKPAVAAMAVTARPAVTMAARRLPCSRDVIVSSLDGVD